VRRLLAPGIACAIGACITTAPTGWQQPQPPPHTAPGLTAPAIPDAPSDPATWGRLANQVDDLVYPGGHIHFEMRWADGRVIQTAQNDYVVPVTIAWTVTDLDNLTAETETSGDTVLTPAIEVGATGPTEVLSTFTIEDTSREFYRYLGFKAQFGDPAAVPSTYAYAIPFHAGEEHRLIQGFGGTFSHTGSNQYAIDFECPEGTPVVAARDGTVVAVNDAATDHGTTAEFTDYDHTNFVLIAHDDGTLGQYMHLEPSGVDVQPGDKVRRGQYIARSGNTGYSTTPHLHFQVMTSALDGLGAVSFPFELQIAPRLAEEPAEGRTYRAWEGDD
jgi:murein DD-endopeptidase MepM/ murein hydrolase activator NlpD